MALNGPEQQILDENDRQKIKCNCKNNDGRAFVVPALAASPPTRMRISHLIEKGIKRPRWQRGRRLVLRRANADERGNRLVRCEHLKLKI